MTIDDNEMTPEEKSYHLYIYHKFFTNSSDASFLSFTGLLINSIQHALELGVSKRTTNSFIKYWLSLWENQYLINVVSYWMGLNIELNEDEMYFYNHFIPRYVIPRTKNKNNENRLTAEYYAKTFKDFKKRYKPKKKGK